MSVGRGRRVVVAALMAVALGLGTAGVASADQSPTTDPGSASPSVDPSASPSDVNPSDSPSAEASPSDASPSPSDVLPSGGVSPSVGVPSQSAAPSAPAPLGPLPPGVTAPPVVPNTPAPGSDGTLPDVGVSDEYWNAFRLVEAAQVELTAAQRGLVAAQSAAVTAGQAKVAAAMAASRAEATVASRRDQVDQVAAELYRNGGAQVPLVMVLLGGRPDDALGEAEQIQQQRLVADDIVATAQENSDAANGLRAQAADATVAELAAVARVEAAQRVVLAAQTQVALTTRALGVLGAAAPQTTIGPDGCPTTDVPDTLRDGAQLVGAARICRAAVTGAATAQAALAIQWAFSRLGSAYACGGAGRMLTWRFDCSSLVSRAYHQGAGLNTAGAAWAPSTRDMVPWDGVALDPHYAMVTPAGIRPGDIVLYDTGGATYRHVVMYLGPVRKGGPAWMLHTNACGDVAKVSPFWGFPTTGSHKFLVARRVLRLPSDPPLATAPTSTLLLPAAARAA